MYLDTELEEVGVLIAPEEINVHVASKLPAPAAAGENYATSGEAFKDEED